MRPAVQVLVAGVVVLLAGCGGVDGQAEPVGDPAFHPCDIPDEVIAGLGLDVETEEREILGIKQVGGTVCSWMGMDDEAALSVFALTYPLEHIRANGANEDFVTVEVAGRNAVRYRTVGDSARTNCDVAVESLGGSVIVAAINPGVEEPVKDPCEVALERTRALIGFIPE